MTRDIVLHTEAEIEILQAVEWYAERSLLATRALIYELNVHPENPDNPVPVILFSSWR